MAKKIQIDKPNVINGYTLANPDKLHRAIFGSIAERGEAKSGVGEDAKPAEVLAAYDKLGGLIRKGSAKVKTGCFWDFENNCAFAKPKAILVFHDLKGRSVELPEGEEVPVEIQAAEKIRKEEKEEAKKKAEKDAKKKAAAKGKKVKDEDADEDEEEEDEDAEKDEDEAEEDVE